MKEDLESIFAPILVVEDEEDHARLIIKSLKDSGKLMNRIVHTENGQLAMDFLLKQGKYENDQQIVPMLIL